MPLVTPGRVPRPRPPWYQPNLTGTRLDSPGQVGILKRYLRKEDNPMDVPRPGADGFKIHIEDEISPLSRVLVHRPGREIDRLTPPNHDLLLFDDLLSPGRAVEEHELFTKTMTDQGVDVVEFMTLFEETMRDQDAKQYVLDNTINYKRLGPLLAPALAQWAFGLPADRFARLCVEGITKAEWEEIDQVPSLVAQTLADDDFLIGPLPNHLFTRDASVWMYNGVAINSMSREVRRRESLHYSAIYQYHPSFQGAQFDLWTTGMSGSHRSAEGGDILVLGHGVLAVGVSERTTPQGVERLADRLFRAGRAKKVLAIMLPPRREFMHLDTVMTQVDYDKFVLYPEARTAPCVLLEWQPRADGQGTTKVSTVEADVPKAVEMAMGRPLQFIWPDATVAQLSREQWNDGFNMLALAPGKVVAYSRTPRCNEAMRDNGIEVLEIDGSELGRGRGGPRCMSCPIERAA